MSCVECKNDIFSEAWGVNYETLGCDLIVQCSKCGRYEFYVDDIKNGVFVVVD